MAIDLKCPNCGEVICVPDANQPVGYLQSHGHGRPPALHMHGGGALLHECVLIEGQQLGSTRGDGGDRAVTG